MSHIVIIGNGISGITTARHVRKLSNHQITVISSETEHFFSRTALMYIYMGHMAYENTKPYENWFWAKNRINLVQAEVLSVDFEKKNLKLSDTLDISYDKLVLATGSKPNKFGWPGQDLKGVQGLYSYQDLEEMEKRSKNLKRAVIVGGGLIGVEMAEMFHSRNIPTTFLVREKSFWNKILPNEESAMINREILSNHIDLQLGEELDEIVGNEQGEVCAIKTKNGATIPCGFVGLTVGVSPNIDFLKECDLKVDRGILINEQQETNVPGVYAVGDCAQHLRPPKGRRNLEQIWYTGKIQGENCARNICEKESAYDPGIFYNSAKFFDIEYQIYGDVAVPQPDHIGSLYWEHNSGSKAIRIAYEKASMEVVGFHLMGVRYRHEVCDQWIREKATLKTVVKDLKAANFDPEFYETYEHEFRALFKAATGQDVKQSPLKALQSLIFKTA